MCDCKSIDCIPNVLHLESAGIVRQTNNARKGINIEISHLKPLMDLETGSRIFVTYNVSSVLDPGSVDMDMYVT